MHRIGTRRAIFCCAPIEHATARCTLHPKLQESNEMVRERFFCGEPAVPPALHVAASVLMVRTATP